MFFGISSKKAELIDQSTVNNDFYDELGQRWYTANDDPAALLRRESIVKVDWILTKLSEHHQKLESLHLLDVGCGAGFVSNALAAKGLKLTGIDQSGESLKIAQKYDQTQSVKYQQADAYHLPFPDAHFEIVTALDFLEHVEKPEEIIKEISRVLKPSGLFFYHTFNRNPLAHLVIIKLVELLVKNVPERLHIIRLFIKPKELRAWCLQQNLEVLAEIGIRPIFSSVTLRGLLTRTVPENFRFKLTKSLALSYMGLAKKKATSLLVVMR